MREGGLGFQQQAKWAEKYGATLDGHAIKSSEQLKVASEQLKFAQLGLQIQFTEKIAPALLDVEKAGAKVVAIFKDPHLTSDQKWKKLGDMFSGLSGKLEKGFEQALPHIADAVGNAAPHIASTFANGFLKAGPLGKLAIGGWLLHRFGGIGAFTALGKRTGAALSGSMASTATGSAAAGRLGRAVGALKVGGGYLAGAFIGQQIVGGIVSQITHNKKIGQAIARGGGVPGIPRPSLTNPTGVPSNTKPSTKTQTLEFNQMADAIIRGRKSLAQLQTQLGKPGSSGFTKNQEKQLRSLGQAVNQVPSGFAYLKNRAASNMKDLNQQVGINVGSIRSIMKTYPAQGRADMETNFRLAMKNVARLLNDGKDHTGTALREIRHLMAVNSGAGAQVFADNARQAIGTLKRLMAAGVVSTRAGTKEIRKLEAQSLQGFGFSRSDALSITRPGGNVGPGGHPEEGTTGHATGGWIGMPGEAGGDNVPIVVGRGEAVLNRYQQAPVEMALRNTYGMGLDDLFAQVQRPHYMAKGGRAYAQGGRVGAMVQAANRIDSKHFPYSWGGGHNDNFTGPYDCSGAVSAILHAGGILQHPMVASQFENFGKPGPGPVTLFANAGHTYMRIGGRYFGTSNSNPGGGAGWFDGSPRPGFVVRHVDGSGGSISTPKVRGPNSPLKRIVQGALRLETKGANRAIMNALASMGQTGGGDWGNFGASGKGSFGVGALARLWDQAGGRSSYANLMAHVAIAESGGNPRARNPSGATGLWQILGSVLPGNLMNPVVNARNAVSKFNSAWPHPLAPWYSSQGGWGRFVGGLRFAKGGRVGYTKGGRPHVHSGHRQPRSPHRAHRHSSGTGRSPAGLATNDLPPGFSVADPDPWTYQEIVVTHGVQGGSGMFAGVGVAPAVPDATGDTTDPNQALIDSNQVAASRAFAESSTALVARAVLKTLADEVNGNLGYRTQQRLSTPSFGSVARA
jgi:hypothetical protein